jgi:hypothetical protein
MAIPVRPYDSGAHAGTLTEAEQFNTRPQCAEPERERIEAAKRIVAAEVNSDPGDKFYFSPAEPGDPPALGPHHKFISAVRLVRLLEAKGHYRDAASWAVHELICQGCFEVIGDWKPGRPAVFTHHEMIPPGRAERRFVPSDFKGEPAPFRALILRTTEALWLLMASEPKTDAIRGGLRSEVAVGAKDRPTDAERPIPNHALRAYLSFAKRIIEEAPIAYDADKPDPDYWRRQGFPNQAALSQRLQQLKEDVVKELTLRNAWGRLATNPEQFDVLLHNVFWPLVQLPTYRIPKSPVPREEIHLYRRIDFLEVTKHATQAHFACEALKPYLTALDALISADQLQSEAMPSKSYRSDSKPVSLRTIPELLAWCEEEERLFRESLLDCESVNDRKMLDHARDVLMRLQRLTLALFPATEAEDFKVQDTELMLIEFNSGLLHECLKQLQWCIELCKGLSQHLDETSAASKVAASDLTELETEILQALYQLGATDKGKRKNAAKIADAIGGDATSQACKAPIANLKRKGLIDTKEGSGGGCWLLPAGVALVEQIEEL